MNAKEQILFDLGVTEDAIKSSDLHPLDCTCDDCRLFWMNLGPDDDGSFGPFDEEFATETGVAARPIIDKQ